MHVVTRLLAGILVLTPCTIAVCAEEEESNALFNSVRSGDFLSIRRLLEKGANVDPRDESGATPLMNAAIYGDVEMMAALLQKGADVNASNGVGATALMWSVGDLEKVRLLLRHGADVNVAGDEHLTPLILASQLPGAADVVALLLDHGADVNANAARFSPLMAATSRGDPATALLLIRRGADAAARNKHGFSAIHGASFNGTAELVERLLDAGADPNAAVAGFTPAMWAAVHGKTRVLKLLVERGADIEARQDGEGTTPLLWASTTGHADVVQFLLDQGADPNVADVRGCTPLTWARRRDDAQIVNSLIRSGGKKSQSEIRRPTRTRQVQTLTPAVVTSAVKRTLPLLLNSGERFLADGDGCVSCHHQSLPAMVIGLARRNGIPVDEERTRNQREAVLSQLDEMREQLLQGSGPSDPLDPAVFLAGLAAEGQTANPATDAAVQYLINRQQLDGRWKNMQYRPPFQQSDIVNTVFGIRSLRVYGFPGRSAEIEDRVTRANDWLLRNLPDNATDEGLRLLGLHWSAAHQLAKQRAAERLMQWQKDDGGWSQLPTRPSDPYATGLVLASLRMAGQIPPDDPRFRKGVRFLLETQHDDGSWFVQTRTFPVQPYFNTRFPHGESQFASITASTWAVMALLHNHAER